MPVARLGWPDPRLGWPDLTQVGGGQTTAARRRRLVVVGCGRKGASPAGERPELMEAGTVGGRRGGERRVEKVGRRPGALPPDPDRGRGGATRERGGGAVLDEGAGGDGTGRAAMVRVGDPRRRHRAAMMRGDGDRC